MKKIKKPTKKVEERVEIKIIPAVLIKEEKVPTEDEIELATLIDIRDKMTARRLSIGSDLGNTIDQLQRKLQGR